MVEGKGLMMIKIFFQNDLNRWKWAFCGLVIFLRGEAAKTMMAFLMRNW
jgi:hypothetical protein